MADCPSTLALESLAAGEHSAEVSEHVGTCDACKMHVLALRQAMSKTTDASDFFAEVNRRASASGVSNVRPLPRRSALRVAGVVAVGLAFAAGFVVIQRPASWTEHGPSPDDTLKGAPMLAVIRERAGVQERTTGRCRTAPGDRLRLEYATTETRTLTAGVLSKDGTWLELQPPRAFEKGTHLSEQSVRVDEAGLEGRVLVGVPDDVARARRGQTASVVAMELVPEQKSPPP